MAHEANKAGGSPLERFGSELGFCRDLFLSSRAGSSEPAHRQLEKPTLHLRLGPQVAKDGSPASGDSIRFSALADPEHCLGDARSTPSAPAWLDRELDTLVLSLRQNPSIGGHHQNSSRARR